MSFSPDSAQQDPQATSIERLVELAGAAGRLALDTEFMGEGRYRTLLCLIQIAVADCRGEEQVTIIDPLGGPMQREPLARLLADPDIEVVVHAGRQDIALLRRALGCEVRNVFDTQVAAGFVGMPAQCSYEALLAELLGVRLAKSASFTRWDARPLSSEQLAYAREDVVHLSALALELQARLKRSGRLDWAREECEFLEQVSDERNVEAILSRLPRIRGMSVSSQGVARELVAWREQIAAERDRPVQSVLGDAPLLEVAKRRPTTVAKLEEIRGIGKVGSRRRASELLAAVDRGLQRTEQPLSSGPRPTHPQPGDAPLIALSEALVRARASEAELAYELLASRADLQAIVVGERTGESVDVRTLRGWRRELVGAELLELLEGRLTLAVSDGALEVARA